MSSISFRNNRPQASRKATRGFSQFPSFFMPRRRSRNR